MNQYFYLSFISLSVVFLFFIEKVCPEMGFGPGFVSVSPINNIKNGIDQAAKFCYVKTSITIYSAF